MHARLLRGDAACPKRKTGKQRGLFLPSSRQRVPCRWRRGRRSPWQVFRFVCCPGRAWRLSPEASRWRVGGSAPTAGARQPRSSRGSMPSQRAPRRRLGARQPKQRARRERRSTAALHALGQRQGERRPHPARQGADRVVPISGSLCRQHRLPAKGNPRAPRGCQKMGKNAHRQLVVRGVVTP